MSSAIQLTATNTILNGQGLSVSANLVSEIATFQNQTPVSILSGIFATAATANANIQSNIANAISSLGAGIVNGLWLIDYYPANVAPVSSANIAYYTVGNLAVASFSNTVSNQARAPFYYGMSEFANVFLTVFGYTNSIFDTVSSANILQNRTYGQSGLGYTGPAQLATLGFGSTGSTIANAIANWGTMYDINNIRTAGDPYVFGQNLLNQGLGQYGNLSQQLTTAGLNIYNLSQIPQSQSTTAIQASTVATTTPVGQVQLPALSTTTTTTSVTGNSTDVVSAIYKTVTGSALDAIVTATGIATTAANLADYLTLQNVVDPATYAQLNSLGITDFNSFGAYLQPKIGKGTFSSWHDLANFINSLEVPQYTANVTANANAVMLSGTVVSNINNTLGTGSGPFGAPIITDYLGAVTGYRYTAEFSTINSYYNTVSSAINLNSLMQALQTAVGNYVTSPVSISTVSTAVNNINLALNSTPNTTAVNLSAAAYYNILTQLATEVTNLSRAGVSISPATPQTLNSLATQFGGLASDKTQFQTYQFFANLITSDSAGDTLRSAVAENINSSIAQSRGITATNDPGPQLAIVQAQTQNIPLSTYITQNQ